MVLQVDASALVGITRQPPRSRQRLQAGKYQLGRVMHITGSRALIWGQECELNRGVLIERIAGLREAQLAQVLARRSTLLALEHPHLARCVDIFVEDSVLYLVLVTGSGQTLAATSRPMSVAASIAVGIQLCNALNFARRQPELCHASLIEPFTTFVTTSGCIKFTSIAALGGIAIPRYRSRFAGVGDTPARRAVFSIGATLHHQLTGWQGAYRDGAPAIATLRPDLPATYGAAIMRALHADPAARWGDSAALRYALLPLLGA